MARLYENGAELQSTTNGVEWDTSTNAGASAFEIDTSTKRSGSASLKFTSSAAASRYFTHLFRSTSATEAVYMRFYIRVSQRPDTTIGIWQANDGATTEAAIGLRSDGALQLFDGDIAGSSLGTSSVLSLNTWYRVELFADNGAGTELDARLDGTSFASGGTIAGEVDTIECGAIDWHTSTAAIFNIDDIAINDTTGTAETSWPGAGKLVLALPTGAGSSNPTTGVYSYINEIPPSDTATSGSTMIELDANPTNGDFNMTDSSTLGIPSDATIKYVSVWARIREEAAGTSNYTLRIRSRSAGTVSSSSSLDAGNTTVRTNPSSTTNFGRWHRAYVIPQDGTSAWTATGTDSIDNMQVGVGTTDGNPDVWCLWLGAYIEYVPVELSQTAYGFYEDGTETASTNVLTYYFDGSDAAAVDTDGVWTNETNADDGDTGTVATSTAEGTTSTNEIIIQGTNAPATGGTIGQVRARVYGKAGDNGAGGFMDATAVIYTDGLAESLGTCANATTTSGWSDYVTLSTPSGGWTWAKIQALETTCYLASDVGGISTAGEIAKVEIEVLTTDITRDVSSGDSNLQLRVRLQNSGGAGASTDDYQLQYELNDSGNYLNVGDGIDIEQLLDSTNGNLQGPNIDVGQSFQPVTDGLLTKVVLKMAKVNSPTDDIFVRIYDSVPTGAFNILATSDNVSGSGLSATAAEVEFTFSTPLAITPSTTYFIRVLRSGSFDGTNFYYVRNYSSASVYSGGTYWFNNSGWTELTGRDIYFITKTKGEEVIGYNSASLTDGNATTNRLGSGSGSFVAGEISEDGLVDNLQITASNYTELLYSLTIESTAVADNDTLDFRVLRNGAVIDTYTVTPRITIEETAGVTIITNDIAISLTEDATTITQDHVISSADITNSLTTDNDTITQDHVIATQDVAISLTTDNTTIIENYTVAPDDTAISLTTDNTTISQNHIFSPDDIAFALTQDNDTIAQNHIIVTQDVAVSLTTDNTTINQNHVIAGDDVAISLTEDNTTVEETNFILATQDIANSLTIDNATITQNHIFSPDDIAFSLTEDNDTISQDHVIVGQDITISLTEDNVIVTDDGGGTVEILTDDTAIALTADATTITQNHVFSPDDIAFSLTQDNDTISQNHVIATQDVALSLTTDNDTILQDHLIVTQDALVSLSEDNTTIEQNHVIASGDALVSLTTDNTTVDESVILSTADITHSLSLDNTTISQNHVFSPDDIAFTLSEDSDTISQNHIIATDDIAISLTTDNTTISQNHLLSAVDIAIETRLDTGYAFDGTTQPSRSYYIDSNGDVYWVINQSIGLVEKV